jgi:hypothetical protein
MVQQAPSITYTVECCVKDRSAYPNHVCGSCAARGGKTMADYMSYRVRTGRGLGHVQLTHSSACLLPCTDGIQKSVIVVRQADRPRDPLQDVYYGVSTFAEVNRIVAALRNRETVAELKLDIPRRVKEKCRAAHCPFVKPDP